MSKQRIDRMETVPEATTEPIIVEEALREASGDTESGSTPVQLVLDKIKDVLDERANGQDLRKLIESLVPEDRLSAQSFCDKMRRLRLAGEVAEQEAKQRMMTITNGQWPR